MLIKTIRYSRIYISFMYPPKYPGSHGSPVPRAAVLPHPEAHRPTVNGLRDNMQVANRHSALRIHTCTSRPLESTSIRRRDSAREPDHVKWTGEQQRFLVQIWADKQDKINVTAKIHE